MAEENPQAHFHEAIDHIRETAKWIVGIFGGIGGVLIASTSLSNVGQLPLDDPRLWVAGAAGLVGLATIGCIVGFALRVMITEPTDLNSLIEEEGKPEHEQSADLKFIKRHPELLPNECRTIQELRDKYFATDGDVQREYEFSIFQLMATVRYHNVYRRFKIARTVMFVCAFIAAIAIVILLWAANPGSPPDGKSLSLHWTLFITLGAPTLLRRSFLNVSTQLRSLAGSLLVISSRRIRSREFRIASLLSRRSWKDVKSRSDTVGLFVWHAEKGRSCNHQNSKIGSRTHLRLPN
jgi:hypothetical protein